MIIREGLYETRNGTLVAVLEVRASGFLTGRALHWAASRTWDPGGRWLGQTQDSSMDLVLRVGDLT